MCHSQTLHNPAEIPVFSMLWWELRYSQTQSVAALGRNTTNEQTVILQMLPYFLDAVVVPAFVW